MAVILGIHSNVAGGDFTGGHAWITVTEGGVTTSFGLWPDEHPRTLNNGPGTDIRKGMEPSSGKANRYYKLNVEQVAKLRTLLLSNVTWKYTNTCASWASELVYEITGKDVDADDWLGFETPRELGANIIELEKREPTSLAKPKVLVDKGGSW